MLCRVSRSKRIEFLLEGLVLSLDVIEGGEELASFGLREGSA